MAAPERQRILGGGGLTAHPSVPSAPVAAEWVEADEACAIAGVGPRALMRMVDEGTIVADGREGRIVFRRDTLDAFAAAHPPPRRRSSSGGEGGPAESVDVRDEPADAISDEEIEQARLIGRFIEAAVNGIPGPCPVCGLVLRPRSWPAHLLEHR